MFMLAYFKQDKLETVAKFCQNKLEVFYFKAKFVWSKVDSYFCEALYPCQRQQQKQFYDYEPIFARRCENVKHEQTSFYNRIQV